MKKITRIVVAGAASLALLALAGCSGSGGGASSDVAPAKSGHVTWYGYAPDTPVAQKYIVEFNKQFPKIKVTYKNFENLDYRNTIIPALESGSGPDVYDISAGSGTPALWGAYAVDLTSLAKSKLGSDWKSKIASGYADQLTTKGHLVALPLGGMSAGFVWYNADILKAAGATMPTDYKSWVATCAKVAAIGKKCFTMGAGGKDSFPTEMYHSIANSVDPGWYTKAASGQAKWDDPQGIEVLNIFQKMQKDGIIASNALDAGQYPLADTEFQKGEAAMVQMGYWYAQYSGATSCVTAETSAGVKDPKCFVQLPAEFPDVAGKGNGSNYFGEVDYGLAINSESPNIGAAKTFVAWMTTSKAGQQNIANAIDLLPALKGVAPDWSSIKLVSGTAQQPAIEGLINKSAAITEPRNLKTTSETLTAMLVAIQQVLDPTNNSSVKDIATQFQTAAKASS
jgi:raffinose/stachyose/melibiose transport system substrate-binding protein